uniref:Mitochondrial glutathione transporter SLC25A39 n=1 Tax=Bos mutus grunniens TaxID=30521 RepID=A0A8C0AKA9_BOSMU
MDPESEGPAVITVTPLQQMFASCTGAILTSLMVTPFDVVKIRLQAQNNPFPKVMDLWIICVSVKRKATKHGIRSQDISREHW